MATFHNLRIRYQTRIPLLGRPHLPSNFSASDYRRLVMDLERTTRHMTQLKPGRRLGASWIDQFVGQRKSVSLCPECQRRYGDWHVKVGYVARDVEELTDCDGCGQTLQPCKGYYSRLI